MNALLKLMKKQPAYTGLAALFLVVFGLMILGAGAVLISKGAWGALLRSHPAGLGIAGLVSVVLGLALAAGLFMALTSKRAPA